MLLALTITASEFADSEAKAQCYAAGYTDFHRDYKYTYYYRRRIGGAFGSH